MARMIWRLVTVMTVVAIMLGEAGFSPACADIYRHVDANGVVHFTNAPQYTKLTSKRDWSFYRTERRPNQPSAGRVNLPHAYKDIIRHYASSYRLEEALVKAVIKAESNYNPLAVSSKGARGLMQLIPETARQMRVNDPFDPMQNIRGGSNYLRLMLDQFDGNIDLAVITSYSIHYTKLYDGASCSLIRRRPAFSPGGLTVCISRCATAKGNSSPRRTRF